MHSRPAILQISLYDTTPELAALNVPAGASVIAHHIMSAASVSCMNCIGGFVPATRNITGHPVIWVTMFFV
ncbi:uncharacterized protein METZ01_LOCUS71999 [marine metagenome]|uniref:Uncharacterized protein n=1 Tax=marine metagenome TaxID=408172 RepID=A0A381TSX3_9ZZZZ|tara:strand:+ start:1118 stop:1330 length:213 start_codon:yes stop_codon:yes gene_type:complete